jgi:hypothetical protein
LVSALATSGVHGQQLAAMIRALQAAKGIGKAAWEELDPLVLERSLRVAREDRSSPVVASQGWFLCPIWAVSRPNRVVNCLSPAAHRWIRAKRSQAANFRPVALSPASSRNLDPVASNSFPAADPSVKAKGVREAKSFPGVADREYSHP